MAANSRNISVPPENGGRNASDIQASNRQLILRLIRQNAVISRTELTERSGLKPATITLIVNEYLKKQVIEDCADEVAQWFTEEVKKDWEEDKQTIVDGGGTFVDFDKQSFIDAMAPLAAQLESEGYWATPGLYDSVQALPH